MTERAKPRLLLFSGPHQHLPPVFYIGLIEPVLPWFHYHFEVTVLEGDRDFAVEVSRHRPDLVVFDSGVDSTAAPHPRIVNTSAHPDVPRAGFIRTDFHGPTRINWYLKMQHWGCEAFFSPCYTSRAAPLAWRQQTIYVPRWLDDGLFHDYGLEKDIPLTLTGAGWTYAGSFYPWRRDVFPQVCERFPFFHAPRPSVWRHPFVGERFAQLLNRSLFALSCGGATRSLVSKIFEIPGANSCLVTQRTAIVEEMGFEHMKNCIFAEPNEIAELLQALLEHPGRLAALTTAGYRFVHDHHTYRQRPQLREWFELRKELGPGQRIAQTSARGPLEILKADAEQVRYPAYDRTPVVRHLDAAFIALREGRLSEAESGFHQALQTYNYMAEPKLGIAACRLLRGDPAGAIGPLAANAEYLAARHCTIQDPANLGYLSLAVLLAGDASKAAELASNIPDMSHPLLDIVRRLIRASDSQPTVISEVGDERQTVRVESLFPSTVVADIGWSGHVAKILKACGQPGLAMLIEAGGEATPSRHD